MTRNERSLSLPQTSLHYTASWGLHPIAEFLIIKHSQGMCSRESAENTIERGTDLTAQNNPRWSPLHFALEMGQVDVARMLVDRGVDLTALNNDGETPLYLASAPL